jgi:hypothetical protein
MKKIPLLIVILIALQACVPLANDDSSATATFTPFIAGTETAFAVTLAAELTPPPSFTPPALPTFAPPSFTPLAPEKPTDFSPVLYGGKVYQTEFFLLLGGVSRDVWLAPELSVSRFSGEASYSLHNMQYKDKYFLWGKSPEFSPVCQTYSIGADAGLEENGFVATLDGWTVTKREAIELSAEEEIYRQAVIDWLAGEGIASPEIGSLHIFRVDLEGDGTDEVFINATHLDESQHTTRLGDYSLILMRKVVGNEVVTTQILGDVYKSNDLEITFPRTYSLANFIDLNQDGILEVVVELRGWEKFGAIVYQIDDGDVIQTLRAEC